LTKITPQAQQLVDAAAKAWVQHRAHIAGVQAQVRARVLEEVAEETRRSEVKLSAALNAAVDAGATKSSLKKVTTRDFNTFERIFGLIKAPAPEALPTAETANSLSPLAFVDWDGDFATITLDPTLVRETEYDRDDSTAWSGRFERYVRPTDGEVFLDLTGDGGYLVGIGVAEWIRASEDNRNAVINFGKEQG
jgi:hypothetical protein